MPRSRKVDPYKNQFLAALDDEELTNLRPHLHLVSGKLGDILFGPAIPSSISIFLSLPVFPSSLTFKKAGAWKWR